MADLQTNLPPLMRVEPLGACSTLVARLYAEAGIAVPGWAIAGLLLGGIVADTLLFGRRRSRRSSTNREPAGRAGRGRSPSLGEAILGIASDVNGRSAEELVAFESKDFQVNGVRFAVSVIETTNAAALDGRRSELLEALYDAGSYGYWSALLVVVGTLRRAHPRLDEGTPRMWRAFDARLEDGVALGDLSLVYSRKKQIVLGWPRSGSTNR